MASLVGTWGVAGRTHYLGKKRGEWYQQMVLFARGRRVICPVDSREPSAGFKQGNDTVR